MVWALVACAACEPITVGGGDWDGSTEQPDTAMVLDGLEDHGPWDFKIADRPSIDRPPPPKPDGPAPHTRCPPPGGKKCAASGKTCTWGFNPSSCYYGKVRKAILKTVKDNPSWFKRDDTLKCDVVLPGFKTSYVSTTVKNIQGLGLCARVDPKDDVELQVKDNATYSEQFRIYSSAKCVRNGGGIYNGRNVPSCW